MVIQIYLNLGIIITDYNIVERIIYDDIYFKKEELPEIHHKEIEPKDDENVSPTEKNIWEQLLLKDEGFPEKEKIIIPWNKR